MMVPMPRHVNKTKAGKKYDCTHTLLTKISVDLHFSCKLMPDFSYVVIVMLLRLTLMWSFLSSLQKT